MPSRWRSAALLVREWHKSRVVARPPSTEIRRKEAFDAYCSWCSEHGYEAVSSTVFGQIMKGELGVVLVERRKNHFYVGIALVAPPKLAVAN
jgi:hypothetical protein